MSQFDAAWRSLEDTVAAKWAPGLVGGVRYAGTSEFFATGTHTFDGTEPMQFETPFRVASLSKLVGGAVALSMVADGRFGLDDEVARWLPELAHPRVLVSPDAPLDQTVPAERPITVRHLLTMTNGMGASFAATPLAQAIQEAGVGPNPITPRMTADEFMARIGALPLAYQPGTRWTYHTGSDLLSVLLARAAGTSLEQLLKERLTGPLGLDATGFSAGSAPLPTPYMPGSDGLVVFEQYADAFAAPPPFETFGGGLVSTVPDYLTFLGALADGTFLPSELQAQMTSDQLTAGQRVGTTEMMGPTVSWGWQVSVDTAVSDPWTAPGRYGWTGGSGTSAFVDPSRDLIGVVFSQRLMAGPAESFAYFWEPLVAAL
jgi:CubicO group peptidase (beta-lactamase class C family)